MALKIGNTPMKELTNAKAALGFSGNVYAKIESANAGGSIKDRVALEMIMQAQESGKLRKGGTIVEGTSGNTGIGLAYVAKELGYHAIIVMPDTMSVERQEMIKSYGGEVLLTDGKLGMTGAVQKAEEIVSSRENCILAGQFDNPANPAAHEKTTGPEIWQDMAGKVDVFVACVGTGGTLTGVGKYLKTQNPNVKIVAVEPSASPLLSGGVAGKHGIQGIGANFIPSVLDRTVYDEVLCVSDEQAFAMTKWLYQKEGAFVGISSGAAAHAAFEIAKRAEYAGKNIVTVFPDGGDRYLSLGLYE
jgi:cysteine synthase A